jgi:SecD/SecF fusion protein
MFEFASNCNFLPAAHGLLAQAAAAEAVTPWYQSGPFMFISLLVLLGLCWFVAKSIAASLRMPEYSGRIGVILITILVSALIVVEKWPPTFGVDLKGGMNLIGSLNMEEFKSLDPGAKPPEAKDLIPNLLKRVDPSGTREIMIRPLGTDKIEVTIPSVSSEEADAIWERLAKAGHLQFRIVASEALPLHAKAIQLARQLCEAGSQSRLVEEEDSNGNKKIVARWYGLAREDVEGQVEPGQLLAFKFVPSRGNLIRDSRTDRIIDMESIDLGMNAENAGIMFARWCQANKVNPQILLMEPEGDDTNVEGRHIAQVRSDMDEYGRPCISFTMSTEGGQRMGLFTSLNKPDNSGKRFMAIVLDGQVHTAPFIQEPIYDHGRITGSFTQKEVDDVIINLRSGKLEVALNKNPISKQYIESNLGAELKRKGLGAIALSFVLVLVFMAVYYRFAGLVACAALILNLLLIMAVVMAIRQPLTLTGLAGLVLTIGMSVDANVLIFERIREELDRGSALRMAIRNGFDKAMTTIVDANVTTLITALVLYVIGTEQIKGFAVTLTLGILMSMFTAIYCARTVFDIAERKRWLTRMKMMRILSKTKYDFIGRQGIAMAFSLTLIAMGIVGIWSLGDRILNHDLRGGSTARVVFEQPIDVEVVRSELANQESKGYDEKVEFTVSKIRDDNYPDRVFKVDSNIPTYDGEGASPYEQLSDVLARAFDGQLTKLHVDVGETTSRKKGENDLGALGQRFVPTAMRALTLTNPSLLLQQSGTLTNPDQDKEQQPPATQEPATTTPDAQKPAGETQPAETGQPENQSNATKGAPPQSGGDFGQPKSETPQKLVMNQNETSTHLTFAQPIDGDALKTFLINTAENLNLELTEEQIVTESPDVPEGESATSVQSQDWTVKLDLARVEDAQAIFATWQKDFNNRPYFPTTSGVGGQIARDTQLQALAAILASLIGIIAYVWIRFQNVAFGVAAVVALIHDVLIVVGAIALSNFVAGSLGFIGIDNFKISLPVVAALLTIIGYSLNDTIVVFDRIREVRGKRSEITADMINTSICQTLSRTILTAFTTFIVVFILYWFGGDAIHGFAFALVVGVIIGTYSSIFIASPVLLWLMNRVGLNPGAVIESSD